VRDFSPRINPRANTAIFPIIWAMAIVFIIFYNGKTMNQRQPFYDELSRQSKGFRLLLLLLSRAKQ
jgi:hypothetical protein